MRYDLVLRAVARREFDQAFDWYERQRTGLGASFAERVQVVFERVVRMPEVNAPVYRDVRQALVGSFPYSVFCRIRGNRIIVLAIFHQSRDPKSWKSRR